MNNLQSFWIDEICLEHILAEFNEGRNIENASFHKVDQALEIRLVTVTAQCRHAELRQLNMLTLSILSNM